MIFYHQKSKNNNQIDQFIKPPGVPLGKDGMSLSQFNPSPRAVRFQVWEYNNLGSTQFERISFHTRVRWLYSDLEGEKRLTSCPTFLFLLLEISKQTSYIYIHFFFIFLFIIYSNNGI